MVSSSYIHQHQLFHIVLLPMCHQKYDGYLTAVIQLSRNYFLVVFQLICHVGSHPTISVQLAILLQQSNGLTDLQRPNSLTDL